MKIVMPGGSGNVGALLGRALADDGHEVVILGRSGYNGPHRFVSWDATSLGPWMEEIDGADVVINLAGRSVNCRYNPANRREILDSRVGSTRILGEAIGQADNPPAVWLQSSTATIYAHRLDAPNDERTGKLGGDEPNAPETWRFSIEVARAWEKALDDATTPRTRKVALRSAMTMSTERGGIFDVMLGLVRRGLGGRAASGEQYISWIHGLDFVRAIYWLIEQQSLSGAVNLCAPNPLPNAEFMRAFRQAWGTSIGLPATEWMLAIGAFFMKTETELILKSRRVVPGRLLDSGFEFQFPTWPEAAADLCTQWRAQRSMLAS